MNWTRKFNKTTKNKHYLSDRSRSLNLAAVPSSSTGGADMPTHKIMSGKAHQFAGVSNHDAGRKGTQEDSTMSTAGKMDKRNSLGCLKFLSSLFAS